MKPYGTENCPILRSGLDWGEDHTVKASKRNLSHNSEGDLHNTYRNVKNKRAARRSIKRVARNLARREILNSL